MNTSDSWPEREPSSPDQREANPTFAGDEDVVDLDAESRRAIEAVLMAATEPVEPSVLAQLVEISSVRVEELCDDLANDYESSQRGFVLARVAGGYRFQTDPSMAPYVERFVLEAQHVRLSGAALETLAIVAYKQPISRGQISAIRGVNVEATLQTLVARGYISETGRDPGPGLALLYSTTQMFLEHLGLNDLSDLPPLGDFVPPAEIVEVLENSLRMTGDLTASAGDESAEGQ